MSVSASPRGKRTQPAAEAKLVEENVEQPKHAKPRAAAKRSTAAKPRARAARPRAAEKAKPKRAAAKKPAVPAKPRARATVPPPVEPLQLPPVRRRRRRRGRFLLLGLAVLALAGAATTFLLVRDVEPASVSAGSAAGIVTPARLAELAELRRAPIYWAGSLPGTRLELRTTRIGTYVRYLPAGMPAGSDELAPTVATYPLREAYDTAVDRGKSPQMSSRRLHGGGIAVWRGARALSVYIAFRGDPYLVEVYAPEPGEARRLALSGRIAAVG
jgi:hypothetical protein